MPGLTRYRYIDALRGFAFLGVLAVHAGQPVGPFPGSALASAGRYGVQLFFLLSAVTLLRSLALRSPQERFPVRNFFVRRLFRIAPLFWSGIVFYFLLDGPRPQIWAPNGLHPWHYLVTFLFLHGWAPTGINSVVPGGWTIAVEMTFYLCLPFLARRLTSVAQALSAAILCALAAFGLNYLLVPFLTQFVSPNEQTLVAPFLETWFPSQLPVFLLGCAVSLALHHPRVTAFLSAPHRPALLIFCAAAAFVALATVNIDPLLLDLLYALVFSLLILALAARPFPIAVNTLTSALGRISFSCYLTHFAAVRLTAHYLKPGLFAFLPSSLAPLLHFLALYLISLLLTIAASTLTYLLIEKPGIALGSRLIRLHESSS